MANSDPGSALTPSQSVATHLAAVDALGSVGPLGPEWSAADQIRYVRSFLEQGIEGLARAEDAQFDFLADCAMLASQNMQDARLHVTDERLAELEDPPGDATIGGFFLELGIILALELAVVATATYAVPALVAFAAAGARARRLRRLTEGLSHTLEGAVTQRQANSESLKLLADAVANVKGILQRTSTSSPWYGLKIDLAMKAVARAERDYAVGLAAHEGSETLEKAVRAALAAAPDAVPPSLTSEQLREMLQGALANTTVGRVAEQVATDDVVRQIVAAPPVVAPGPPAVFQTSALVGRFLESNERARAEAARQWDAMRFHIRVLPDQALVGSEIAQKLLWQLHADPPPPTGPGPGPGSEDAQVIARGMEVALWLEWMQQTQALAQRAVSDVPITGFVTPKEGEVWEDLFITSLRGVPAGRDVALFADGVQFSGLRTLADGHARHLYGQFARDFFVRTPDAAAPLEFDAARYDTVDAQADEQERSDRLAEMKLLTIVFFQRLRDDPTGASSGDALLQAGRKVLPALLEIPPELDVFAAFLASQPPTSEPDGALPAGSAPPDPAQEALDAFVRERVARDDAAKLRTMVTDLDLQISLVPTESPDASSFALGARLEAELQLEAIQLMQTDVQKQYDTFLEHAAGETALLDEVKAEYEARIKALVAWPELAFPKPAP
jgi:hypothetical protein